MNESKNFFYEKPLCVIALIFVILSVIDIVFATVIGRGVIFDGSIMLPDIISSRVTNNDFNFELNIGDNPRGFVNFVNTLPLNLLLLLPVKSKAVLAAVFGLPFFLNNFLLLVWQYFLTLRTKRTDIFLSALLLHVFVIIPLSLYAINEISLASSALLLLFHYLSADIEYKKRDMFFILFLSVFTFLSTEAILYCGVILFLISIYYVIKAQGKKAKAIKIFIGLSCLVAALFQNDLFVHFSYDFMNKDQIHSELEFFKTYFGSYYFKVDLFFILSALAALFFTKKFNGKTAVAYLLIPVIYFVYTIISKDYISTAYFSKRFIPTLLLPLIFIVNTLIFVFLPKISEERKNAYAFNIAIIFFVFGIVNLLFSLNNSVQFNSSINYLRTVMNKSDKTLLVPFIDTETMYYEKTNSSYLFNCDTYIYDSINFSRENKLTKIIVPVDIPESECPKKFYFADNTLNLQFSGIPEKTTYWDLSGIKEYIENNPEEAEKYKAENFEE